MMATGYSKRSLIEKLGIKSGFKIAILGAPESYAAALGKLPEDVSVVEKPRKLLDFIHFFCKARSDLEREFHTLRLALAPNGMLWISWPKTSAKAKTDLNENRVREVGLKHGLVDVKVCAVDETWSGLKFVIRKKDRK